jgi:elongation factor P
MKIQANTIRPGNVIEHGGKQWTVLKIQLLQPGKGSAFIQVEMRDVKSGLKSNERFRTAETVEKLMVDEKQATFLYAEDNRLTFMDSETYEQFEIDRELVGAPVAFLQDGMIVTIDLVEGAPIGVRLPQTVVMQVVEAEPVVRGQTASSSYKPAIVDNGVRVMVPPHIETGTRIVVNTSDATYVERAKD